MDVRGGLRRSFPPRHDGDGFIPTAIAIPGNTASTFLTHFLGSGLSDVTEHCWHPAPPPVAARWRDFHPLLGPRIPPDARGPAPRPVIPESRDSHLPAARQGFPDQPENSDRNLQVRRSSGARLASHPTGDLRLFHSTPPCIAAFRKHPLCNAWRKYPSVSTDAVSTS